MSSSMWRFTLRCARVRRSFSITTAGLLGLWACGAVSAAQTPGADRVAVTVNGEPVMESEVQLAVRALGAQQASDTDGPGVAPPEESAAPELRSQAVDSIVNRRLIEQFVQRSGVKVADDEVQKFIDQVRKDVEAGATGSSGEPGDAMTFDEYLAQQGQTQATFRSRMAGIVGWQKYMKSQATEAALQEHFRKHQPHFDGTKVHVSQILLKVPETAGREEMERLADRAEAIRREVVEGRIAFADAAKKYSQSPSAGRGGDLGFIPRRPRMFESFSRTAFDLKVGEISQPLLTPQGLHLITVTEIRSGNRSFNDARQDVLNDFSEQLEARVVSEQREKAKIDVASRG